MIANPSTAVASPLAIAGPRVRLAAVLLGVAAVEAILVWLGLRQGEGPFSISPIWPAAGFAIAATFRFGYRVMPAIAAGECIASALHGIPLVVVIPFAVIAGATGGLGAWLLHRWTPMLGRAGGDARDAVTFLLLAGGLTTAISAALGTGGLILLGDLPGSAAGVTFHTWWLGDAVGVVVFAPFVLAWLSADRQRVVRARPVETAALVLGTLAAAVVAFGGGPFAAVVPVQPAVAVLPFLVWGALRFGVIGAATCNVAVAVVITAAAVAGTGPYAAGDLAAARSLQFLIGVTSATTIVLGATASRRDYLQQAARQEAEFVRSIADNLPGAVFRRHLTPDDHLHYSYMTGRLASELGIGPGERTTLLDPEDWTPPARPGQIDPRDRASMRAALRRSAETLEPVQLDLRMLGREGTVRWGRSISRPKRTDDGGTVWDGILLDVTEEREQRARVEFLARHDPLTALLNRNGLHETLAPALSRAQRHGDRLAFCLLDLDGFKEINDSYGHAAGDAMLRAFAERIGSRTRLEDINARLGGDEFLVVHLESRDGGGDGVEVACRRLLNALSELVRHGRLALQPSVSMGVAIYPDDGASEDAVLAAADQALHVAKTRERGNLVFYSPDLETIRLHGRIQLGQDLGRAIEQGGLNVHYQPQVEVATGRITGVEALARWTHPLHGPVPPSEFVALAEHRGLAAALDLLVLRQALTDLAAWRAAGHDDLRLAVNLSGASVRDAYQRGQIADAVRDGDVPGDRLELELTESTLVQSPGERVGRALHELSAAGVRFAVDDFGTGYGSLTYLRTLPVARIKIDRSFVQGAPNETVDREIVRALIQLGANLGMDVIAEGIETTEHLETVRTLGGTDVQGYHFARPMPADELAAVLARPPFGSDPVPPSA